MKNILVLISILFLSFNVLAKSPGKTQVKSKANVASKKYAKGAFKFDLKVYYKLKFPDRQKYLTAYIEFVKAVDTEINAKADVEFNLYQLLFPKANAQYGVDHCITGGIYYAPPCGQLRGTEFPDDLKSVFPGCTNGNRCAAYFGLDATGNGLCFTTESRATSECAAQSSVESVQRLNQALSNKYDPKAISLQKALDLDFRNNALIEKYCMSRTAKSGACDKLQAAVTEFKSKVATNPTSAPVSVGGGQTGGGCTQAEVDAINSSLPSKSVSTPAGAREAKATVDPLWYSMMKMGAAVCPGENYDDLVNKLGVCNLAGGAASVDVEMDLRLNDTLRASVDTLMSGRKFESRDQEIQFTNYFGLTPQEFKNVICIQHKTNASAAARLAAEKLPLQVYSATDAKMFSDRRNRFKSCVKNNMTQKPDALGNMIWQSNSKMSTCHFKPAALDASAMLKNPDAYKGKLFFSDNVTGSCFSLDKVSDSCSGIVGDISALAEKNAVRASCEQTPKPTRGDIALEFPFYLRLSPVYQTGNFDKVVSGKDLKAQYSFYEMNCGSNATEPCNLDNDNCGRGFENTSDR